ncbi:MAG: ligase-associated DNA damage response DEXH box helicase [Tepidisphaeraceae bacterium]
MTLAAEIDIDRPLLDWFEREGWSPFAFQRETWRAYLDGQSGLVHAPTGSGKTLAVLGGPMLEGLRATIGATAFPLPHPNPLPAGEGTRRRKRPRDISSPLTVLWLTPLRALASDTAHAISRAAQAVVLNWSVELRTSDTASSLRRKQLDRLPSVLVTTPESLSVLLSYPGANEKLGGIRCVVVDEWHELLSTKRGVQTELGIAHLQTLNPAMRRWGLSATLGNLDEAMRVLMGPERASVARMIHAKLDKTIAVETLFPPTIERFPWAGHVGLKMVQSVAAALDDAASSLVFTNTRSQAEVWFKQLLAARPDLLGQIAVHHGSLDRKIRGQVEQLLRDGKLRAVVCTSSLDLGVDFASVEQVLQVGSPKGIARLMQRAGRSGHQPGEPSVVRCVPTHAFELVEFSAARQGIETRNIESRVPLQKPLDVLAQHVVTIAMGTPFDERELLDEVRRTHAYRDLTDDEWRWTIEFASQGGASLGAYDRFKRIVRDETGRWTVASAWVARMHRLNIGTITSDGVVQLMLGNRKLGTIEESFIGKIKPGEHFIFAGRPLELIGMRQMTARVRMAKRLQGTVPQWAGGRFPLSTQLAAAVRGRLDEAGQGVFQDDEMAAVAPLLAVQQRWSAIPAREQVLVESIRTREGGHHVVYAFLGRLVHEGLGAVLAHRLMKRTGLPVTATFNDYGIELLSPREMQDRLDESAWRELLSADRLSDDLITCLNTGELTKRQFREIARVAGLVLASTPGQPRSNRQLQASSELFFDVFNEFDPGNLLLEQARREVLERQLEFDRLASALRSLEGQALLLTAPARLTPMAFPIWAQRIQSSTLRVEDATTRIERMVAQLERASQTKASVA